MAYGAVKVDKIITSTQEVDVDDLVNTSDIGTAAALNAGTAAGNVPVLDGSGKLASGVLPSYVDDVLEYANLAAFPATGETGKIYVALDSNKTYRWSGSAYIEISSSPVTSVAGRTGAVTLSTSDVSGLGTAAAKNVGTSAGNVVELDGSARLPAVDGSQLTGINATTDLSYTAATRVLASSTGADATLPLVTSSDAGLAPASGGGTANFLRADGTWAAPAGGVSSVTGTAPIVSSGGATPAISISAATTSAAGSMSSADKTKLDGIETGAQVNVATDLSYTAATRVIASSTGTDATLPLVTSTDAGLAPASGGGTTTFLRADGTWATAGSPPGGSDTQVQFNDGGAFGGDSGLVFNKTTNKLTAGGDIELNDGGTYTTTVQTVTPTANRTISFPDATGTVGLVAGSSGQVTYNNAGAYAGVSTMTFDGTSVTLAGRLINSYTSLASSPAKVFTGTWFTGGTSTTTKPHFLIEPSGATSTAWSTSGTGLGVNAASGFAGNLLDLQVNGTSFNTINGTGVTVHKALVASNFNGNIFSITSGAGSANSAFRVYHAGNYNVNYAALNNPASGLCFGIGSTGLDFGFAWSDGNTTSINFSNSTAIGFRNAAVDAVNGGVFFGAQIGIGNSSFSTNDLRLARDAAATLAQRNGTNAQTFRCYGTYTDASNYVRAALSSTSTAVTLAAETAGTGADDIPLNLTAAGTGTVKVNSNLEIADAKDIVLATGTGTKIGTATTQKLGFYNATPVVQPAAVANITTTATAGSLPTANGTVTIADAAAPTVTELLEYCVELEAKLEAALSRLRDLGLIAT